MIRPGALLLASLVLLGTLGQTALADWRDDLRVLRVGVLARTAFTMAQLERFRTYLEARTDLPVELVPFANYPALIDGHASSRVDYAIHTALSYAATEQRCGCVEPLAAPVGLDGARGFHAVLIASAQSSVFELADLKGKRLALTAPDSLAGYLAPWLALEKAGLDPESDLGEIITAADPRSAVAMVLDGRADVAAAWSSLAGDSATGFTSGVFSTMVADASLSMNQIRIIWASPLIPFGPHAVRSDLPAELKILLAHGLASLAVETPWVLEAVDRSTHGGGGFAPIQAADYDYMGEILALGDQ